MLSANILELKIQTSCDMKRRVSMPGLFVGHVFLLDLLRTERASGGSMSSTRCFVVFPWSQGLNVCGSSDCTTYTYTVQRTFCLNGGDAPLEQCHVSLKLTHYLAWASRFGLYQRPYVRHGFQYSSSNHEWVTTRLARPRKKFNIPLQGVQMNSPNRQSIGHTLCRRRESQVLSPRVVCRSDGVKRRLMGVQQSCTV